MHAKLIIRDRAHITRALATVEEIPLDPVHEVIVRPYVKDKSAAQRGLQWLWNTEVGNYLGHTKDEMHDTFKEKFAVSIFTRDDQGYAAMVEAVKNVRRQGMKKEADELKREIIKLTSTEDFNTKQCAEYLTEIEHYAAKIGAPISFPEDQYQQAMGRKKQR